MISRISSGCQCVTIQSPVGKLLLAADASGLLQVHFQAESEPRVPRADGLESGSEGAAARAVLDEAVRQLAAYFAKRLQAFDLPLAADGTPFQRRVWQELRRVPYGQTISYGELARRIGRPGAARAVGAANRTNPIAIVVPCHRVIGASGALVGFGGGLEIKERLLEHEGWSRDGRR